MPYPPKFHKHPRLPDNDYTKGAYFVTLCTHPRREWFGRIMGSGTNAVMEPNEMGRIIIADWNALPGHYAHLSLDQFQLMPDHLHGIIVLDGCSNDKVSTLRVDAAGAGGNVSVRPRGPVSGSLGAIIGAFKSGTTYRMNTLNGTPGQRYWQLGYHERCIRRTGGEFERIAAYIAQNPMNWR